MPVPFVHHASVTVEHCAATGRRLFYTICTCGHASAAYANAHAVTLAAMDHTAEHERDALVTREEEDTHG
ncbi:MAG: hypothetical protein ACYDEN_11355 [Acidimicrobiales bacterium]